MTNNNRSGSGNVRMQVGNDGVGGTNVTTTSQTLAAETWYFLIGRWDQTATTIRVEVYDSSGNSIAFAEDSSVASNHWPVTSELDRFEIITGGQFRTSIRDNVFVADAYAEPLEDNLDITSYTNYGGGAATSKLVVLNRHRGM